jgi:hypothetical protein
MQAFDRVHRFGQTRPVNVVRFMMKDSIEETMMAIQQSKLALGKGSFEELLEGDFENVCMPFLKNLFGIKDDVTFVDLEE